VLGSLLAFEVVHFLNLENLPLWLGHPFAGVGVVDHIRLRLVSDDEEGEVFGAGVDELMSLSGREDEVVTRLDRLPALRRACLAAAGEDVIGLPLGGMLVERKVDLPRRDAVDFEVERVAAAPGADVLLPSSGDGQRTAGEAILALRGVLRVQGRSSAWARVMREE
jgi:hypothetical protein